MFKKNQRLHITKEIKTKSGNPLPSSGYYYKASEKFPGHHILSTGQNGGGARFRVHEDHLSTNSEDNWMTKGYSAKKLKEETEKKITLSKKVKNKISTNLTAKDVLREAYLFFGRFNPPTVAHKQIIETYKDKDLKVYLSHTEGNSKNPIPYAEKLAIMREAFGDVVVESEAKDIIQALAELSKQGYDSVVILGGSDRQDDYQRLNEYNGVLYNFLEIAFETCGDRDDLPVSATQLREAIRENGDFLSMLPEELHSKADLIAEWVSKMSDADNADRADYAMTKTTTKSGKRIWRKQRLELSKNKKNGGGPPMPMNQTSMNADNMVLPMIQVQGEEVMKEDRTLHPPAAIKINNQERVVQPDGYYKDMQKLTAGRMDIATFKKKYGIR